MLSGIGGELPGKQPVRLLPSPKTSHAPDPADVAQIQKLATKPEQQVLARVAVQAPELVAHAVQSATLQALQQGFTGSASQLLACVALNAMKAQPDLKSRAIIGHTYLEATGNNPTTLTTLEDPLAAQTYQTALLQHLDAPTEPGLATRQKPGTEATPGANLFEYANGRVNKFWLGVFRGHEGHRGEKRSKEAEKLSKTVFEELKTSDPRVRAFHQAAGDMRARDRVGVEPLKPLLEQVDQLSRHEELGALLGSLHSQGIEALLTPRHSLGGALRLVPNAAVMGSDLHRVKEDHKFLSYAETLFRTAGLDPAGAARVQAVGSFLNQADLQTEYDQTTRRAPSSPVTLPGYPEGAQIAYPKHLSSLENLLGQLPLDDVKLFLRYSVLNSVASELGSEASKAALKSDHRLNFYPDTRPEAQTRSQLKLVTQQAFVDRVVTPEKRQLMQQVFDDVRTVYRQRLENTPWLSDESRQAALAKLDRMQLEVGGPENGFPPVNAELKPDSHLANVLALRREEARRTQREWKWENARTEKPNAYYVPSGNSVMFSAGFLLDHALRPDAEPAELYGVIGFVMAHEIGHGFEGSGTRHDADGNHRDWLTSQDRQFFEMKMQGIARQLQEGDAAYNHASDAASFRNEAAADLTGLSVAYEAFLMRNEDRTVRGGHTPEQRFFLHFATEFSRRDGNNLRVRDLDAEHPANEFRINNAARNLPAYAAAFGLAPGTSAMALEQAKRAGLW